MYMVSFPKQDKHDSSVVVDIFVILIFVVVVVIGIAWANNRCHSHRLIPSAGNEEGKPSEGHERGRDTH